MLYECVEIEMHSEYQWGKNNYQGFSDVTLQVKSIAVAPTNSVKVD